jgi:peptide deformylase
MALLPIITAPDPRLKIKAKPVRAVDEKVRRLMDDMVETMYHAIGVGLAAPQVGVAQRVLVIDVARDGEKPNPLRIANPEILWRSETLLTANEGCLSLPEHYADVERKSACATSTKRTRSARSTPRDCSPPVCNTRSTISTGYCSSTTSRRSNAA